MGYRLWAVVGRALGRSAFHAMRAELHDLLWRCEIERNRSNVTPAVAAERAEKALTSLGRWWHRHVMEMDEETRTLIAQRIGWDALDSIEQAGMRSFSNPAFDAPSYPVQGWQEYTTRQLAELFEKHSLPVSRTARTEPYLVTLTALYSHLKPDPMAYDFEERRIAGDAAASMARRYLPDCVKGA